MKLIKCFKSANMREDIICFYLELKSYIYDLQIDLINWKDKSLILSDKANLN